LLEVPYIVVGGGVLGLQISTMIAKKFPQDDVFLLEKEKYFNEHSSSRNSGVLHSGIYYPTNSKKHILCIEGNEIWHNWCRQNNIRVNNCGKYIVASTESELPRLDEIFLQGEKNQVSGQRFASGDECNDLSKYLNVVKAIFVSSTSVLDTSSALKEIENNAFKSGVHLMKEHLVSDIIKVDGGFQVSVNGENYQCKNLINCAGLGAIKFREMLGLTNLENYFVKGHYLKTIQKFYQDSLVYPIPSEGLIGLGVHTSFDFDNVIRFGPDNLELSGDLRYGFENIDRASMELAIEKTFPKIDLNQLAEDYSGIRSKIKLDGKLFSDFWIQDYKDESLRGYIELCGIDSPGLTSSWAITNYVEKLL
jgi:L-2-hydroxyglutarate oxidase LhgO